MLAKVLIRRINADDIEIASSIISSVFAEQTLSKEWLGCLFRAFPKSQGFVAEKKGLVIGLIFWTEKSGFRPEAFVDLEHISVHPEYQRQGIGTQLILESLPKVADQISKRGAVPKSVIINSPADSFIQELYKKTLGAQPIAVIDRMLPSSHTYMLAKDVQIPAAKPVRI